MKYTLFFTFLFSISTSLFAQNTSTTTDNIIENHLYHANNGQGIGYYEGVNLITEEVFLSKLNNIPSIASQYESGQNIKLGGALLIVTGIGFAFASVVKSFSSFTGSFTGLGSSSSSKNDGEGGITTGIIFSVLGAGIILEGRKRQKKAMNIYNNSISGKIDLSFGMGNNGLGLFIGF